MKIYTILFYLLLLSPLCHSQDRRQNDLEKRSLFGKVKTIKTILNDSKKDYTLDSFDVDGYLVKSDMYNNGINFYTEGDASEENHRDTTYTDTAYENGGVTYTTHTTYTVGAYTDANNSEYTKYYYSADHHLLSAIAVNSHNDTNSITMYKYNNRGQLMEINYGRKGDGQCSIITTYEYDANGNNTRKEMLWKCNNDAPVKTQVFTYKYNNRRQIVEARCDDKVHEADCIGPFFININDDRLLLSAIEEAFEGKAMIKYDTAGKMIEQDVFDKKSKPEGKLVLKYDQYHNILKQTMTDKGGKPFSMSYKYTYDMKHNWTLRDDGQQKQYRAVYNREITYY